MKIVIDLDLHEAIADFSVKQPASTIELKSQDTPSLDIYFVQGGVNQDLGTGATLKFGMIPAAGGTMLVLYSAFTRQTDAGGNIYYLGYPVFNTAELSGALGSSTSITCSAEVRYQVPAGELIHCLDIPFTVFRTILSEVTSDTTTASFIQPAVNANVSVAIGSTTWLALNQQITITGGGIYKVVSITDATHFVAENLGAAGAATPGATVPASASVINTPLTNLITYPPASGLELISSRDVASGHAGLTAATLLNPSVIPVDNQTIGLNGNGQLASSAILAVTSADFITPAANGMVSVSFVSTSALKAGSYVRIPIAGFYIVESITNATTALLENNGDPFNALAGVTITSGAVVLPAQAAAAGGGTPGQNAYTTLSAGFTVPNAGATVSIDVISSDWMGGPGYALFIAGAGYYLISAITDTTHVVVMNSGSAANQPPGSTVNTGSTVVGAGPQGAPGATGASLSAYDALTASFIMPAMNAAVTVTISNTAWLGANQIIYIASAGYFQVTTIVNATTLSVTNLPYPGNASSGATISSGSKVSPAGLIGPQGAGGPGLNAFTTLSANFTQPAVNASVTVNVGTTAWMAVGQGVFIQGGGYYSVNSIADLTHAVLLNLGSAGNAAPASTIVSGTTVMVTPAGTPGVNGTNAYTATTAAFTTPASGASVTVIVADAAWASPGQVLFVAGAGYYQVAAILSATQFSLTNLGANYGNTSGGTNIAAGASVSASGVIGPAGPAGAIGSPGAAGRDGAYSTVYTGNSIQGNGGVASVLTLVGDSASPGNSKLYGTDPSGNKGWYSQPSGGGGGGASSPSAGISDFDDFDGVLANTAGPPSGKLGWLYVNGSGGLGWAPANLSAGVGVDATNKAFGVWRGQCSSTANTGGQLYLPGSSSTSATPAYTGLFPGLGVFTMEWRVSNDALNTATIDPQIQIGIGVTASGTLATLNDGIFFELNWGNNGNANWWFVVVKAGTRTKFDCGVAPTLTPGYDKLAFTTNAGWTSISATINGAAVGSPITTNIPIVGMSAGFAMIRNFSVASGTRNLYLDYYYRNYQYSR